MYAKLENGGLRLPVFPLGEYEDIFTNDPVILAEYGYKAVRYTETPNLAENAFVTPIYTETATEIVVSWEIHESDEATEEDYINALAELGVELNGD